jgi:predicted glycosyltransferase
MKKSPDDWFWLLRFHPATSEAEKSYVFELLKEISPSRAECEYASRLQLYTLLRLCNVHVTGHSTCAFEALSFGVPTITVTQNGADAFRQHIKEGVISYAEDVESFIVEIRSCEEISAERCRNSVEDIFAPQAAAGESIRELLSIAARGVFRCK